MIGASQRFWPVDGESDHAVSADRYERARSSADLSTVFTDLGNVERGENAFIPLSSQAFGLNNRRDMNDADRFESGLWSK